MISWVKGEGGEPSFLAQGCWDFRGEGGWIKANEAFGLKRVGIYLPTLRHDMHGMVWHPLDTRASIPRQSRQVADREDKYQDEGWRTSLLPIDCLNLPTYLLSLRSMPLCASRRIVMRSLACEGNERRRRPRPLLLQMIASAQC